MPCGLWPGVTPGVILGLGVLSGAVLAALVANVWWAAHRRLHRMVLGTAVDTLAARLERLRHDAVAFGPDGDDLQRCAELCATVQRLVEG